MKHNLFLIGMPGTGKTTVGRLLASSLGSEFLDTDLLIEETAGLTVEQIFSQYGEARFRAMEREAVKRACALRNAVVSLGGGAITQPDNLRLLKGAGTIVLLQAGQDTLLQRLQQSGPRPLLQAESLAQMRERLILLERTRGQAYLEAADIVVDAEAKPEEVERAIMARLGLAAENPPRPKEPKELKIHTGTRAYSIWIGVSLKHLAACTLGPILKDVGKIFVITNPVVSQLHAWKLTEALRRLGHAVEPILMGDGERYKSLEEASRLYDILASKGADRSSTIIAVGGGVTGDLAGFVAATYMRGLRFVQVPTTLLAQVDSSIGGKVAVDHPAGKNLVGAFHQPEAVLTDVSALCSLPDAVFSDGMAEVIKTAIIGGEDLFRFIEMHASRILAREPEILWQLVVGCAEVKARIVEGDERDTGPRMTLNLGHTFGHAIEAACQFQDLSHGQAVAVGTCVACRLAEDLGLADHGLSQRVVSLFQAFALPTAPLQLPRCPDVSHARSFLATDKKRHRGSPRFIVPFGIGDVRVVEGISSKIIDQVFKREWGG